MRDASLARARQHGIREFSAGGHCPAEAELPAEFKLYLPVKTGAPMDQPGYAAMAGSAESLSDDAGSLAPH